MTPPKLRLAFVGCGEITRTQHLPAALSHPAIEIAALVDSNERQAARLARHYGIEGVMSDYRNCLSISDAVVNALPNALHAAVTLELLSSGKHVLCEKPLATTSTDALACTEMAAKKGLVLAVGMNRRFDASHHLLHCILRERQLGNINSYDWQYGSEFEWTSATAFYFSRELAGGGVLMDFGVHLLDSLVNWFGPITHMEYQDDDWGGGIEANCILHLRHDGNYGLIGGRVQMSRTVALRNRLLVKGSNAVAEIRVGEADTVKLHTEIGGQEIVETLRFGGESGESSFYKQLDNFVKSIRGNQQPEVDGRQAAVVLELVEWCYAHRRRIPEPWSEAEGASFARA